MYAIATVVYSCFLDKAFVFANIANRLLYFNASGPFYYVLMFIQLLLVSPMIYYWLNLCEKRKVFVEFGGFVITIIISIYTTNFSNILDIYGGGGKLLGGSYLILLYIGMWFGKYNEAFCEKLKKDRKLCSILFVSIMLLTIAWIVFYLNNNLSIDLALPFGKGANPPGLSLGLYGILVMLLTASGGCLLTSNAEKFLFPIVVIGKNTLSIFLYHRLVIDYLYKNNIFGINSYSIWTKRVVLFLLMIIIPMMINTAIKYLHMFVKSAYGMEKK